MATYAPLPPPPPGSLQYRVTLNLSRDFVTTYIIGNSTLKLPPRRMSRQVQEQDSSYAATCPRLMKFIMLVSFYLSRKHVNGIWQCLIPRSLEKGWFGYRAKLNKYSYKEVYNSTDIFVCVSLYSSGNRLWVYSWPRMGLFLMLSWSHVILSGAHTHLLLPSWLPSLPSPPLPPPQLFAGAHPSSCLSSCWWGQTG